MEEPVYLITSFRRSGSSMMARCLKFGGLPVLYYEGNDTQYNIPFGQTGYIPNPNGFYAIEGYCDYQYPTFYEDNKGKVIKIPRIELAYLPKGKYKLIFMLRPVEEVFASYRSFIGPVAWGDAERGLYFRDFLVDEAIKYLKRRGDFEVLLVNYHDVLNDPIGQFQRIKDFGVPIDVDSAASGVDSALYRHRLTT